MPNENVYTEAHGFKFPNGTTIPIEDAEARQDISEIKQSLSNLETLEKTASGTIVTFDDGSDLPMPKLEVAIEPQQQGRGDPSPENVRPISGFTKVNVVVSPTTDAEDGTTYTIKFKDGDNPLTVYGGTLDVVNGVLTVDMAMVDLGTLNWTLENGVFRLNQDIGAKKELNMNAIANIICSAYPTVSQVTMATTDKCVAGLNWSNGVRVSDSAYANVTDFKTAMNGVQLVYELATPITYQLTPTQVNSLLGVNNIWADTGDLEIIYFVNNSLVQGIYDMINVLKS